MKRLIISISVLFLLASFSMVPTFAGIGQISDVLTVQRELVNPDSGKTDEPGTNYVAELNKMGMAGRPESDNAAPYYLKAIELYVKEPEGLKLSTRSWSKELPAQEQALLRKWVQDNNTALEQLQLGSQKSFCWFKYTGETLQKTEMPHLSTNRQLALALQARAMISAEDGNIAGAVDDIVTLYKFGAHITAGPRLLVEKIVGIAVKSLSIRAAFNIIDRNITDETLIKSLEEKFKQPVTDYSEPFDIRGEKICLQELIETNPKFRAFKPYLKSTLDYYDMTAAKTTFQLHNEQTPSASGDNPLIEAAGSEIPRFIEIESRIRAEEQALITTLALLRYNADKGGYPAALPGLISAGYIKELPIDPYSNKHFVYKQTTDNFTLYSFGADFDDDGGLQSKWGSSEEGGDQVFWPVQAAGPAETEVAELKAPARPEQQRQQVKRRLLTGAALEEANKSLFQAIVDGDIDRVKSVISAGADVNSKNYWNWTPLHAAARHNRKEIAELLIASGADINGKDQKNGKTPLHFAVEWGQKDVVELLIAKGADVNTMSGRNENALSLANNKGHKEIADLLVKHGAKEPTVEDLEADRYYRGQANLYPNSAGGIQPQSRAGTVGQSPAEVDILADPNEIRARIKTFKDLEKALEEIAGKSKIEMRHWEQKKYDNRTYLARAVQKQFEEEIGFIRNVAVEEKAKKTIEAIDSLLSVRKERSVKVNRELLEQKRELKQMESARTRVRARPSGRSTRGRPQRGQPAGGNITEPLYDRDDTMPGMDRNEGVGSPSEQIDKETENQVNQWLQATIDKRADLAKAVHEQIRAEITSVRRVAVEEKAKKTTASIDGLLLARQERLGKFTQKMEEEQKALQQTQDQLIRSGRYPQAGRTEQENQPRNRGRRR